MIFRCLSITATENIDRNKGKITSHKSSGIAAVELVLIVFSFCVGMLVGPLVEFAVGFDAEKGICVGMRVELGELKVTGIVTVCVGLQSLDSAGLNVMSQYPFPD
jgi:hypothetical protein